MIGKKRDEGRLASVSEVMEILEERKKDGELGYEQQLAFDYMEKFSKLGKGDSGKMQKQLEELGLSEPLALKTIEIMPIDAMQMKLILAMDKTRAPTEDDAINKMMEVVKSYSK
ncbi:MAG: DNA-directed RNA polymerase subunit F [Candidatus Micrarchaeota archaeon]|nr:DNA-directed RNA polymerase subunit F [Candidatus Micrarchaeota archaeon]MDE1859686.1 DNA-directed RNA polymerase subunit F [Candidatus Micrarchaeota archaeon]